MLVLPPIGDISQLPCPEKNEEKEDKMPDKIQMLINIYNTIFLCKKYA